MLWFIIFNRIIVIQKKNKRKKNYISYRLYNAIHTCLALYRAIIYNRVVAWINIYLIKLIEAYISLFWNNQKIHNLKSSFFRINLYVQVCVYTTIHTKFNHKLYRVYSIKILFNSHSYITHKSALLTQHDYYQVVLLNIIKYYRLPFE